MGKKINIISYIWLLYIITIWILIHTSKTVLFTLDAGLVDENFTFIHTYIIYYIL
jgi:hypothetical protein